jgi:hypothetical protein
MQNKKRKKLFVVFVGELGAEKGQQRFEEK